MGEVGGAGGGGGVVVVVDVVVVVAPDIWMSNGVCDPRLCWPFVRDACMRSRHLIF